MMTTQTLGRTNYLADMTQPQIPPAGITTKLQETAKDALTWNSADRPQTPADIKKFRQSTLHEPGKIVRHYGAADDPVPDGVFGDKSGIAMDSSAAVQQAIQSYPDSDVGRWKLEQAESVYASTKREPLGHGYVRGHKIPNGLGTERPFGVSYDALGKEEARQAATIVFPTEAPQGDDPATHTQYIRSHADYDPGEQRRRNYNWQQAGIDPVSHRFGAVDKADYRDGVRKALQPGLDQSLPANSKVLPKHHEDFKATATDYLGKPKPLGAGGAHLPPDFVYGAPSLRKGREPGVGELMSSSYPEAEQQPDADLGKSIREGFRNMPKAGDETRSFGVPSIRTDIALPKMRSVANAQNFGNEPDAGQLLRPHAAAELGISDEEFVKLRPKDEMAKFAEEVGMSLGAADFDAAWALAVEADAAPDGARACLDTFFRARHHLLAQSFVPTMPPTL